MKKSLEMDKGGFLEKEEKEKSFDGGTIAPGGVFQGLFAFTDSQLVVLPWSRPSKDGMLMPMPCPSSLPLP